MTDREELLQEHTLKGVLHSTHERAYATLCGCRASDGEAVPRFEVSPREAWLWMSRLSMAMGVLLEVLENKGRLTADEIDEILLTTAGQ